MPTNLDKFKADLKKLKTLGSEMKIDLDLRAREKAGTLDAKYKDLAAKCKESFEKSYQRWYTESYAMLKQLLPDRLPEFIRLYQGDPKRKAITSSTYTIQDWLNGVRAGTNQYTGETFYKDSVIAAMHFYTQLDILESVESRFESSLFDMAQLVRADLFDSELDAARELQKHGFLRAAGTIAGVVIERHLAQVCTNHNVVVRKKDPTIADLNDLLKNADVLDVPNWRQVQRLGDIRNLCSHNKNREPTPEEIAELIEGADELAKTLF